MKNLAGLIPLLFLSTIAPAQSPEASLTVKDGTIENHPNWRYVDVGVDLKKVTLRVLLFPGGELLSQKIPSDALAAINGGYFDEKFKPTGWLRDSRQVYTPRIEKKTGGVLTVKAGRACISRMANSDSPAEFALQNGPLLLEPGGTIGIHADDGKGAARTVACVVGKYENDRTCGSLRWILVLSPPHGGPTLMQMATFLKTSTAEKGFACDAALNLDGGPSTGVWFSSKIKVESKPPAVPIGYGVGMFPTKKR